MKRVAFFALTLVLTLLIVAGLFLLALPSLRASPAVSELVLRTLTEEEPLAIYDRAKGQSEFIFDTIPERQPADLRQRAS
jgi:hypothetical protein